MDSDEAFNEFIVFDEGESGCENENLEEVESDSEKENKFTKERKHIKNEQYVLIANFVTTEIRFKKYSELWDGLADELNKLGPHTHTSKVWRKMWSSYKMTDGNDIKLSKSLRYVNSDKSKIPRMVLNEIEQSSTSNINLRSDQSEFQSAVFSNEISMTRPNAVKERDLSEQPLKHESPTTTDVQRVQLPDQSEVMEKLDTIISILKQQGLLITRLINGLSEDD